MGVIYQVSLKNCLSHFTSSFVVLTASVIVPLYFYESHNGKIFIAPFYFFLFLLVIYWIPPLIIFIKYYHLDKLKKVTVYESKRELEISSSEQSKVISFDDVLEIEWCLPSNKFHKNLFHYNPWDPFTYMKLKFRDNNTLIMTSLMYDFFLDGQLEEKIKKVEVGIAWPKKNQPTGQP